MIRFYIVNTFLGARQCLAKSYQYSTVAHNRARTLNHRYQDTNRVEHQPYCVIDSNGQTVQWCAD